MNSTIRTLRERFLSDALFHNSIYLILTTASMGVLGFFFWIICTHLYTPDQIGLGTTLISAMTLISFVSLLGFNSTFVRSLPSSQDRSAEINTGSILVIIASVVISLIYIALIPYLTPKLAIVYQNYWYLIGFVILVALTSINSLTDSVFIAYRSTQYNLITDGFVISITKLILPFVCVGLGAYGVFAASGLAIAAGMAVSVVYMVVKFGYRPRFVIHVDILKRLFHYSFTNYLANLINMIPTLILPIIIINYLGAAASGYFYLAFMIINLLYAISGSVSQSLFAEGSYAENELRGLVKRALVILVSLMIPGAVILAVCGPLVLEFFGKSYSNGGASVIVILSLASPAVAAYTLGGVILRIRQQMYSLIAVNIIYAVAIIGFTLYWVHQGLTWVAIAWTIGNLLAALVAFICIFVYRRNPTPIGSLS